MELVSQLGGALPALLAAPAIGAGTVFLVLLSLCVIMAVFGALQFAAVVGAGDERIERRLGLRDASHALSSDAVLLRPQDQQPAWLGQSDAIHKFAARLDLVFPGQTTTRFFLYTALGALLLGGLASLLLSPIPWGLGAAIVGGVLPYLRFRRAYGQRLKILADQLEEALDFLARVLRAGHSLASGLQMVGNELPEPIATEFRRCYEQHNLGLSLEDALADMAKRMDLEDFAFFVTSVSIQRQTGGDLAEILDNINAMIRARVRLAQHVRALTAEGRFTGYVLTALPVVVFCLMFLANPEYAKELFTRPMGRVALFISILFQVLGLLTIRKIVNIKV